MSNQKKAFELREQGKSWGEVGVALGISSEAARALGRRYGGDKIKNKRPSPGKTPILAEAHDQVAEAHGMTASELKAALSSLRAPRPKSATKSQAVGTTTGSFRFLVCSDTHIGHEKFHEPLWEEIVKASRDVDLVLHPGDHLEGMSGRPGHIYELAHVGYAAQKRAAVSYYSAIDKPMYGIDGNHDQWFKQKGDIGAIVGEDLEKELSRYTHLGEWEGQLEIHGVKIRLFHANDGSAYAHSYKLQKLIESFTGGEKPDIVLSGHYHKALYQFSRNVHGFESGTVCGQSRFMRGKKMAAHIGFWVVTVYYGPKGVSRIATEFIPGFE